MITGQIIFSAHTCDASKGKEYLLTQYLYVHEYGDVLDFHFYNRDEHGFNS